MMNQDMIYVFVFFFLGVGIFAIVYALGKKNQRKISPLKPDSELSEAISSTKRSTVLKAQTSQKSHPHYLERLKAGLAKTRSDIWDKFFLSVEGEKNLDEAEGLLYAADLSPTLVETILNELKRQRFQEPQEMKVWLKEFFLKKIQQNEMTHKPLDLTQKPLVVMIVGVNGVGKTTTVGKLAAQFRGEGKSVMVAACDTFRAAAVEQLAVWSERSGAVLMRAKEGADPSGLAFEAVAKVKNEGIDVCLVDTAGRLHTSHNLMDELNKTKRVMEKAMPGAPHEVWLVLDAITGQNALKQALEFHKSLSLTGLIFTKCDGSAKAGSAISIIDQLAVPIRYIGVGESVEDLQRFSPINYVTGLVGE
jgi:fused signal recognition particle receptor